MISDEELEEICYIEDPQEIIVEFKDPENREYFKRLDVLWEKEFPKEVIVEK
jgi:hypothetical protein